jgi:DNA/RNA-binding domain of Phe-tRNA-synthetase-like protein
MNSVEIPEEWEAAPEPGWVDRALAEEFPGLSIVTTTLSVGAGRSNEALKERLRTLSDRFAGAQAIQLRQQAIPWAYRVFFRHIGLDPDQQPTPIEQLALDRMRGGRFKSENRVDDSLTIAMVESGVAIRAFDADRIDGRLGLRLSAEKEGFEGRVSPLPEGTIVIADEQLPLAVLFGKTAGGRGVTSKTKRTALAAIGVRGVPDVALEEGLWIAASAMHA